MSNIGRPTTGLKPCAHCTSTDRDSNGQCRCRNTLYRLTQKATSKAQVTRVKSAYNDALAETGTIEAAVAAVHEEFPSMAARARRAPADKKPVAVKKTAAQKKAAKVQAEKQIAETKAAAQEKVAAEQVKDEPVRYILHILDDFTDPKPYARKDAAIKNGVRSDEAWCVTYKGKTVAQSDDVL